MTDSLTKYEPKHLLNKKIKKKKEKKKYESKEKNAATFTEGSALFVGTSKGLGNCLF